MDNLTSQQNATVKNSIYLKAVEVARSYLGPSAERFINRQIEQHLLLKPEDLAKNNLSDLAKWVKISSALITDQKTAEDFEKKILEIN